MKALFFLLSAFVLLSPGSNHFLLNAPSNVVYTWEKKKALNTSCKTCYLKLSASAVTGATHYDWEIEAANTEFTKTTMSVNLPYFYVEPGKITVKVRARNASQMSDWLEKSWDVKVPGDCCLE